MKYRIFDCNAWKNKESFSAKYFKDAKFTHAESEGTVSQTLTLERNDKYHNEDEDPKVIEKKKLSGGAVAGIVIGVIVAVAALMIGEFFLVKKICSIRITLQVGKKKQKKFKIIK